MFTVVKVREGLAPDDYKDRGWFKHPEGTVAYEWRCETPSAPQASEGAGNFAAEVQSLHGRTVALWVPALSDYVSTTSRLGTRELLRGGTAYELSRRLAISGASDK